MLTRKPSAAAPAAYPTGKECGAALPPPPGPRASPRGMGAGCSWDLEQSLRCGGTPGRTARPGLGSAHCCTRAPRLLRVEPCDPAGRGPSQASPRLGLGEAVAPPSAFQAGSRPAAVCNVDRPTWLPAGSRTRAPRPDLTLQPLEPRPWVRAGNPCPGRPFALPDAPFYCPRLFPRKSGVLCPGVGRGHGVWVTFSPLTLFCLLPRVAPRPRRGQRRSSASGFPGARSGGPPERSGDRPALPHRPAAPPGQQRCCRSPHGETQPAGGRGEGVREELGA